MLWCTPIIFRRVCSLGKSADGKLCCFFSQGVPFSGLATRPPAVGRESTRLGHKERTSRTRTLEM